jgi:hypothetical protein
MFTFTVNCIYSSMSTAAFIDLDPFEVRFTHSKIRSAEEMVNDQTNNVLDLSIVDAGGELKILFNQYLMAQHQLMICPKSLYCAGMMVIYFR